MRWSEERIWNWYNSRPWLRGCNYMSADCANRVDQWQALGFEERLETTRRELQLMRDTGFNTVRLILEYVVWRDEHDSFMERFERYISLCDEYGISCMIVLANDCMAPKSPDWKKPEIGPQHYDWGYHGGKKASQHSLHNAVSDHFWLDEEDSREDYFRMVEEIVTRYKDDPRICIWDVYNEPGFGRRWERTMPILQRLFALIRAIDPIQPLTACTHSVKGDESVPLYETEQFAIDNSDIISYHCYKDFNEHIKIIRRLKKLGRPLICTEWLGRIRHNDVFRNFPVFFLEKIGCYCWGFVAGLYQTYEPWESSWTKYYQGKETDLDFTKWFHDLYRPNHRPYDPKEIELIQEFCQLADK